MPYPDLVRLEACFGGGSPPPEILCLGDSVLERISRDDTDRALLGEMLKEELEDWGRTECFSRPGWHWAVYRRLLEAVLRMKHRPRSVILSVNLRSFSPAWYLNPLWRYEREIEILKRYAADPSGPAVDVPGLSEKDVSFEAFDAMPAHLPPSPFRTAGEFRRLIKTSPEDPAGRRHRLMNVFLFHYAHRIGEGHPLLEDLRWAAQRLPAEGISLSLYFTPINFEAGNRLLGGLFASRVAENKRRIAEALDAAAPAIRLSDHSAAFGSGHFFTPDNATEHLRQEARRKLAVMVTSEMRRAWHGEKLESSHP